MRSLGDVERCFGQRADLCDDFAVDAVGSKRSRVGETRRADHGMLGIAGVIDGGAVRRAAVVALAVDLRWVVALPKPSHQIRECDGVRVEHDSHRFGMPCVSHAHLLVAGRRGGATSVAHAGEPDSGKPPKTLLGAPETACCKHDVVLPIRWERAARAGSEHVVLQGFRCRGVRWRVIRRRRRCGIRRRRRRSADDSAEALLPHERLVRPRGPLKYGRYEDTRKPTGLRARLPNCRNRVRVRQLLEEGSPVSVTAML
eukprot:5024781-Prymnesium_polylepis.2